VRLDTVGLAKRDRFLSDRLAQRVLLVCWEGADWQMIHPLLDAGRMPHLASIVENGVMGDLMTLQPQLSPLLWTSVATGKRADKHGILGYLEVDGDGVRSVTSQSRRAKAVWNILNDAGLRTHIVGWPSYPAEAVDGVFTSNLFTRYGGNADSPRYAQLPRGVHPLERSAPLAELRIAPTELSHEELLPLVPRAAEVDQQRDPGLAIIATWLAESTSTHSMATWALEHEPWDFAAVHYDAIDRFGHTFMQYHPPRRRGLDQRAFEIYRHVMDGVYCYSDMMLGRLLELAGPDATVIVISDHGFRLGRDRPQSSQRGRGDAGWHRPLGILAMRGPAVRRDEWVWGASLLDICPTVLALLGLPIGQDMQGRPLVEAFEQEPRVAFEPSWETPTDSVDRGSPLEPLTREETRALLDHLVDERYLEREQIEGKRAAEQAMDAKDFNLAQVYLEQGRVAEAADVLQGLVDRRPGVPRWALKLAECRLALGDGAGCRRLVEEAIEHGIPAAHARRILAQVHIAEGQPEQALVELFDSEQIDPRQPGIHCEIGEVYAAMERWDEARRAFAKELKRDPDSALSHTGLGRIALVNGDYELAVEELLIAISLWQSQPNAHFLLGTALAKLGKVSDAIRAFEQTLALNPHQREAHCSLAKLYEMVDGRQEAAARHRKLAEG